jgi:hypothetical protein
MRIAEKKWLELRANCPVCKIEAHPRVVAIEIEVRINKEIIV